MTTYQPSTIPELLPWADPYIAGLHLDFEGYAQADKAALVAFRGWLASLDAARKQAAKGLSAFFPADDRFAPYDAASAARVDYWVAQVYDAHSVDARTTGPLCSRNRRCITRTASPT